MHAYMCMDEEEWERDSLVITFYSLGVHSQCSGSVIGLAVDKLFIDEGSLSDNFNW